MTSDTIASSASVPSGRADARRNLITALEVLAVLALMLIIVWRGWHVFDVSSTWRAVAPWVIYIALGGVLIGSFLRVRDTPASLGLAPKQWGRGWPAMAAFIAVSLAAIGMLAWAVGNPSWRGDRWWWMLSYTHGLVGQQLVLQCFLNNRLWLAGAGRPQARRMRLAILGSSAAFVILHAPNPVLMGAAAWTGLFWTWHFRRHHNLLAILASHLLLGAAVMVMLGQRAMMDLAVGLPAWRRLIEGM